MDARIPTGKSLPKNIGIARRGPRLFHLLIARYEANIVDQLSRPYRKGEKMPACAEPHLPAVDGPIRNALMRHQPSVRDRFRKHRFGRGKDIGPKLGMDTIGTDDQIGFLRSPLWKRKPGG